MTATEEFAPRFAIVTASDSGIGAATAVALTVLSGSPGIARAAGAPVVTTFPASDAIIANPGRGFFRYSETHLTGDPGTYRRLDPVALAARRTAEGVTVVFRYFYLDGYRDRDTITAADLGLVRADLTAA